MVSLSSTVLLLWNSISEILHGNATRKTRPRERKKTKAKEYRGVFYYLFMCQPFILSIFSLAATQNGKQNAYRISTVRSFTQARILKKFLYVCTFKLLHKLSEAWLNRRSWCWINGCIVNKIRKVLLHPFDTPFVYIFKCNHFYSVCIHTPLNAHTHSWYTQ